MRTLCVFHVGAGKHAEHGVEVNLAPRANKVSSARDDNLVIGLAGLLSTLEESEVAKTDSEDEKHISEGETTCNADALATNDVSTEIIIQIGENSMIANASQFESAAHELHGCEDLLPESSGASETQRAAPCLDYNNFDPEVEEQLKLAADRNCMKSVIVKRSHEKIVTASDVTRRSEANRRIIVVSCR